MNPLYLTVNENRFCHREASYALQEPRHISYWIPECNVSPLLRTLATNSLLKMQRKIDFNGHNLKY